MNQATYAMVTDQLDKRSVEYEATFGKPDEWTVFIKPKGETQMIPISGDMSLTKFMEHVDTHKRFFP